AFRLDFFFTRPVRQCHLPTAATASALTRILTAGRRRQDAYQGTNKRSHHSRMRVSQHVASGKNLCWTSLAPARTAGKGIRGEFGNSRGEACYCRAVMAVTSIMSSMEQPRERSVAGLLR